MAEVAACAQCDMSTRWRLSRPLVPLSLLFNADDDDDDDDDDLCVDLLGDGHLDDMVRML